MSVSYFHTIFARKHVVFLKILYCLKKICTTAGRDEFQVSAVTTVMNSFFCRRWESFSIFSNAISRHLFDCDWNGLAATTGIISYYHWLSRFDSLETGMDLVAPAAHVWAPHRQRRQGWARRKWPRGPDWPFCHWQLALCISFDSLKAEEIGTPEHVTIIQIYVTSIQHTVRPSIYKQTMNKVAKKYLVLVVCQTPQLEMGSLPKVSS